MTAKGSPIQEGGRLCLTLASHGWPGRSTVDGRRFVVVGALATHVDVEDVDSHGYSMMRGCKSRRGLGSFWRRQSSQGQGSGVQGLGFRVQGPGSRAQDPGSS